MSQSAALRALCEAARHLGIREDLDDILDEILQRAHDLIGFDHCALLLAEPKTEELVLRRSRGFDSHLHGMRIEKGRGLSGWAAEHLEAVRIGDVSKEPRYIAGLEGAHSNMVVPLVVQNELVGVINVESRRRDAFSEEHEMLLTLLGTHAALAIVASRAQRELHQEIERLDALYRISALSWVQKSFDEVVQAVLNETQRILPEGELALLLLDPDRRHLSVRVTEGYSQRVQGMKIPLGQGVTGRCALTGEVQLVEDVTKDPDYILGVPGAKSELALPLASEGRVIGVLSSESKTAGVYDRSLVRFLSVVAQQVAAVLHTTKLQEEAYRLAVSDPLTNLFNRRYFQERLADALARASRYDEQIALAFFDLDYFKAINDRYGHPVGDRVLRAVAASLQSCARTSDLVARIGGEEFAVLLLHAGRPEARAACERMWASIAELEIDSGASEPISLTTSVGVALYPQHAQDSPKLFSAADEALYQAKRQGRNRVVILENVS